MRTAIGVGLATILLGAIALLLGGDSGGTVVAVLVGLLAIFGVVATVWKLLWTPGGGDSSVLRPPWTEDGQLFEQSPERTRDDDVLSGESFAAVLAEADRAARSDGTIEAGLETVRPVLRRGLADALSLGMDRAAAEASIDDGRWTDDRAAASTLAPSIDPPRLSLRERIEAWLFPERVVRRRLQRTVQAIAEAADEAIPDVPGQNAPRNVPIVQPTLDDLQRGVDGRVQRAIDPLATARGPRPPGEKLPTEVDERADSDDSVEGDDSPVEDGDEHTDDVDATEAAAAGGDADDSDSSDAGSRDQSVDDRTLFVSATEEEDR